MSPWTIVLGIIALLVVGLVLRKELRKKKARKDESNNSKTS